MLPLEEARRRILEPLLPGTPSPERLAGLLPPTGSLRPRFCASEVRSPVQLPAFDNSSVDGYAVRAADTASPAPLRLRGRIAAGNAPETVPLQPGEAIRIFTGAPLPPGADAVAMQEDCQAEPGNPAATVRVLEPVKPWENVRFAGEDVRIGEPLLHPGDLLTPGALALLLASGVAEVPLHPAPTVRLIATGDELRPAGTPLPPGCIHESNLGPLALLLESAGARVLGADPVADEASRIRHALENAGEADVIVTVGGASVGEHDLVKACVRELGFQLDLWRIDMKPGKPFFAAVRSTPERTTRLYGLPGNPVSALVTATLLVLPAIRKLAGARRLLPDSFPGTLAEPLSNPGSRRHFMRVQVEADGSLRSAGTQASHVLSSFARAHGLVDVPAGTTIPAGTPVSVLRLHF